MKKIFFIIALFLSVNAYSQNLCLGVGTHDGKTGFLFCTEKKHDNKSFVLTALFYAKDYNTVTLGYRVYTKKQKDVKPFAELNISSFNRYEKIYLGLGLKGGLNIIDYFDIFINYNYSKYEYFETGIVLKL